MRLARIGLLLPLTLAIVLLAAACGDDDSDDSQAATPDASAEGEASASADAEASAETAGSDTTSEPTPTPEPESPVGSESAASAPAEIMDAGDAGSGISLPIGNAPLPDDYSESEYLFGGMATSYVGVGELTGDGFWEAEVEGSAPYRTRMIVRLPPAEAFSGVVLVEWMNVTAGADTTPDWGFLHEEIARSGHGYVAVSVQEVGVNGVADSAIEGGLIDTRGLVVRDPDRYGTLEHPGDAFAFDIFTQAGAAVAGLGDVDVLDGLVPEQVIALGESQSAIFMTTYVNAINPLVGLYDGFFIHSRGASALSPDGEGRDDTGAVLIRTDVPVPVFTFEAETDILVLGFEAARQPDSAMTHTWEVAGTAHADSYSLAVSAGLPRDASLGNVIGCAAPINDGPQHETLQAALSHMVAWVEDGATPPRSPRIEIEDGPDGKVIARDDLGIAHGGVRTPPVDVPTRVLSGDPSSDDAGLCFLFGQTQPLPEGALGTLYTDEADYVAQLETSAAEAVANGWLLPDDAETMVTEETARVAELGLG